MESFQEHTKTTEFKEMILDLVVESTKALSLLKLLPKSKENGLKNGILKCYFFNILK